MQQVKNIMNRRTRVLTALAKEKPDRPPLQVSFTKEFAERLMRHYRLPAASHDPMGGKSAMLETITHQDMLLHAVGWVTGYFSSEENEFYDEWGISYRRVSYTTPFGTGSYAEVNSHPLRDDVMISSYKAPDPTRSEIYAGAEELINRHKNDWFLVGAAVTTIFETAWALRGLEQLLMDFLLDPDLAEAVLDIPFRYHSEVARRLVLMGYDMIRLGDDVGGQQGMLMSPDIWRRFLKPKMAKLIAELKTLNPDIYIAYHSDGNIEDIIPDLIEIGLDVLNPIQPACMDPALIKKKYGDKLVLWGTIDEQDTLPFKKPDDVKREVLDRINLCGSNGGLILGPTHHVQLDTPIENFEAMIEAALS
jgi:uroporphyrinogen decarboxylase